MKRRSEIVLVVLTVALQSPIPVLIVHDQIMAVTACQFITLLRGASDITPTYLRLPRYQQLRVMWCAVLSYCKRGMHSQVSAE
jgi:hypothetical protein